MLRNLCIVCIVLLAVTLAGCSSTGNSIMAKQIWSENYAKAKGVEATSPLMIDGDQSTVADSQLPTDSNAGSTRYTEAFVKLPEPKSIRKIVINSPNLQSFTIYSGGDKPNDWKSLTEIKNGQSGKIEVPVSVKTDRIKIKVDRTSDDSTTPGGSGGQSRLKRAPAKIKEIELYGMVQEPMAPAEQPAGTTTVTSGTASTSTVTTSTTTSTTTVSKVVEVPKGPAATATIETTQKTFPLAGPIPLKINIKTGAEEQTVLDEIVTSNFLSTKLVVKNSAGETIASIKPTPPLSSPKPRRFADKPVDVREARILDPDSVLTVDVADLLSYYPIKTPGTYTIQLVTWLELQTKYVGREQTEKADTESQIREINSKANYTATEKAALIQSLKDDLQQSQKKKAKRYIEATTRGTQFKLESNTIDLIVQ
jgi:hypothetical protein